MCPHTTIYVSSYERGCKSGAGICPHLQCKIFFFCSSFFLFIYLLNLFEHRSERAPAVSKGGFLDKMAGLAVKQLVKHSTPDLWNEEEWAKAEALGVN